MHRCEKLLLRAQASPSGLRFEEACQLAECYGYVFARQRGSHRLYKRDGSPRVMNLQADRGMAKEYQVRQLLAVIARDADLDDGRNTP
jgi:predicted RNA binding protein YcfA (HicA-like mRNA interferase family)